MPDGHGFDPFGSREQRRGRWPVGLMIEREDCPIPFAPIGAVVWIKSGLGPPAGGLPPARCLEGAQQVVSAVSVSIPAPDLSQREAAARQRRIAWPLARTPDAARRPIWRVSADLRAAQLRLRLAQLSCTSWRAITRRAECDVERVRSHTPTKQSPALRRLT